MYISWQIPIQIFWKYCDYLITSWPVVNHLKGGIESKTRVIWSFNGPQSFRTECFKLSIPKEFSATVKCVIYNTTTEMGFLLMWSVVSRICPPQMLESLL